MTNPQNDDSGAERAKSSRRPLILMALIALAPFVASYAAYYWLTPSGRVNYGELLDPAPAPSIAGTTDSGRRFALDDLRGKWLLLVVSDGRCDRICERALYATRQARTIQGREQDRVARVLVQSDERSDPRSPGQDGQPSTQTLAQDQVTAPNATDWRRDHPDLTVAYASTEEISRLPWLPAASGTTGRAATPGVGILLLDPRGNLVLRYPADPDIKRLAGDLRRLLSTSQIG